MAEHVADLKVRLEGSRYPHSVVVAMCDEIGRPTRDPAVTRTVMLDDGTEVELLVGDRLLIEAIYRPRDGA